MNVPKNVLWFEVLLYLSLTLDALSVAFQDRTPSAEVPPHSGAMRKHRAMVRNCVPENLEIPDLVLAHHSGMTLQSWMKSDNLRRMEWTDEGIVLGVRRHGESSAIVELLTRSHGRHLGLVRGGSGSRLRPLLQRGNSVSAVWRARLDEHLGTYAIEGLKLRAATLLAS